MLLKKEQASWVQQALRSEAWRATRGIPDTPNSEKGKLLEVAAHVLSEGEPLVPVRVEPDDSEGSTRAI